MVQKIPYSNPEYRVAGVHNFELRNGLTVTGISENTWDDFETRLRELPAAEVGHVILTPELITTAPDPEPSDTLDDIVRQVTERIGVATELSRNYPDSTLITGTAFSVPHTAKPANGAIYLQDGEQLGQTRKMPYSPLEAQHFAQATISTASKPLPNHPNILPIICSDLLFHRRSTDFKRDSLPINRGAGRYVDPITPAIDTLLVSSYWQIPVAGAQEYVRPDDNDYGGSYMYQMRDTAGRLFNQYASLQDIVVIDRAPTQPPENPLQPIYPPYNAHFRRGVVEAIE